MRCICQQANFDWADVLMGHFDFSEVVRYVFEQDIPFPATEDPTFEVDRVKSVMTERRRKAMVLSSMRWLRRRP